MSGEASILRDEEKGHLHDPGESCDARTWPRRIVVVAFLAAPMLFALGGSAQADEFDPLEATDPVTDLADPVIEEAIEVVDPVLEQADEVVEPVVQETGEVVDDVVQPVIGAVDPVVEVLDPVVEVLDPVIDDIGIDGVPPRVDPPRDGVPSPPQPGLPLPSSPGKVEAPRAHRLLIGGSLDRGTAIAGSPAVDDWLTSGSVPSLALLAPPEGREGAPSDGASAPSPGQARDAAPVNISLLVLLAVLVATARLFGPPISYPFAPRVVPWNAAALALSVERPG